MSEPTPKLGENVLDFSDPIFLGKTRAVAAVDGHNEPNERSSFKFPLLFPSFTPGVQLVPPRD